MTPVRRLAAIAVAVAVSTVAATPAVAAPRDQQWYLDQLRVPQAQQLSRGDDVTIGLLTNGLPVAHPDLGDRVLPTMRLDDGPRDTIAAAPADYPVADPTATAQIGLMTARGGAGLLGVAPGATVRPVICPGTPDDTARCLRWLVDSGVDVIDFSQAAFDRLGTDFDGLRYALAHDVVVVMALSDGARLPAEQRAGVLLVGGVDRDGALPSGAGSDNRVGVRAPGPDPTTAGPAGGIIGLDPAATDASGRGRLLSPDGDEVAAALVTGVVALLRSKSPDLTVPTVLDRILRTAADRGDPGRDAAYGFGIVDAEAALRSTTPAVSANPLGDPEPPSAPRPAGRWIAAAATLILVATSAVWWWFRRRRRASARPGAPPVGVDGQA